MIAAQQRAAELAFWSGPVEPQPLGGGLSNHNFVVQDGAFRFVVRVGDDLPVHGVVRRNELAASRAASAAGLSPEVVYVEPGVLVLRYVDGARPLTAADVQDERMLPRLATLLRRCHQEMPAWLRGPALMFWVFHSVRDYGATLYQSRGTARQSAHLDTLGSLLQLGAELERAVGRIDVVFGHNDLLPANLLDDGRRLWLIDWEYAGYNSPLFDLGGLASNAELSPDAEAELLRLYWGSAPDPEHRLRYEAMKCASLLRETLWSMAAEIHSTLEFDYSRYTRENLDRLTLAVARWRTP